MKETCKECEGQGELNICKKCGKMIKTGDYCPECQEKHKVYILQSNCDIEDLEIRSEYKGKISRVENYGVFVSLCKKVFGLLRMKNPSYQGDEILVKVMEIKKRKRRG